MIKIINLIKKYGRKIAVNNLNLSIPKRSVYGLLGLNGAGKTTTLNIIATLTLPTKGDVIINECSIRTEPDKVRKSIGILPQDSDFPEYRSVLSIMEYYCSLKSADKKEALDIIHTVGLDDVKNTKIAKLSHGMRQSLSLGQALIGNPKVLLLDEPFSGLDPVIRNKVRTVIKQYAGKSTILISSHDLNEIEKVCDRIGIIKDGVLVLESKLSKKKKISLEKVFLKAVE